MFSSMTLLMSMILIISSPLLMMSMKSWIIIWMFLEISSMSFIMIMKSKMDNEGSMIYFLAQSFGSMMILFSLTQMNNQTTMIFEKLTMMMGMMIKMGLIPFHQWFVILGSMISLYNLLILSTIQKLAPLFLMSWSIKEIMFMIIISMSMIMSLIMQMTQQILKKMLIYSSIFQTSWLMIISMMTILLSMVYFFIYSITLMMVIKEMKKKESKTLNNQETKLNMNLMLNMTSMSGIPPMLGFIPKWMMLKTLSKEKTMIPLSMLMIILSIISFFIYFRMFFSPWMKTKMNMMQENMKKSMMIQIFTPIMLMMYL